MAELHPREEYTAITMYLFYSYDFGGHIDGYSLYGIDIPTAGEQVSEVGPPRLLVRLPLLSRSNMVCAKFGSKFYFLGGLCTSVEEGGVVLYDTPSDVFVYDPTDTSNNSKDAAVTDVKSMNYGKANPTTFEVNGRLYVLGTRFDRTVEESSLFEEYDPVKNRWTRLMVPPVSGQEYGSCSNFVLSTSRVLIAFFFGGLRGMGIFTFNPRTYEWSKWINSGADFRLHSLFVKDSFYGVEGRFKPGKLGPCTFDENNRLLHVPAAPDASIDWGDTPPISWRYAPRLTPFPSKPLICQLSDRCFGIIDSASCVKPGCKPHWPDPNRSLLKIIVYEELQGDETCFNLRCLHQSLITFDKGINSVGFLTSCHVMSAEDKNKGIQVDDKEIRTNRQKKTSKQGIYGCHEFLVRNERKL